MKKFLSAVLCLIALTGSLNIAAFAENSTPQREGAIMPDNSLDGIWEGSLPAFSNKGTYFNDLVTININSAEPEPVLLKITSMNETPVYTAPRGYQLFNQNLNFELYDDSWYSVAQMKLTSPGLLQGSYSQKGHNMPVEFRRVSETPLKAEDMNTEFLFDGETYEYWHNELISHASYTDTALSIPYTYELSQWENNVQLINMFHLDEILEGKNDIEIMKELMKIVNENFTHDGSVAITDKTDPLSIIALHNEKGGIECRGLSLLLSEMLRLCRIEAKPIMCISAKEPAECHVVVHAYSPSLNQWIMLDPTYNLMLTDEEGNYLDLPSLRNALINNEVIHANSEANYNSAPFSMARYREYMTKNTFRFANARNFYFGADFFPKTDVKGEQHGNAEALFGQEAMKAANEVVKKPNPIYMLVPNGYNVPFVNSREEIITRDAEAFWALPERSKEIAEKLKAEAELKAKHEAEAKEAASQENLKTKGTSSKNDDNE